MPGKTAQLQIRVSPEQKRTLKRLAAEASMDLSAWILERVLPRSQQQFQELVAETAAPDDRAYAFAELADFLRALPRGELERAIAHAPRARLDPAALNHLAAVVELSADRRAVKVPEWAGQVPVPDAPVFGSTLGSLRLYMLTHTPIALRRRNLFMDAAFDQRV